MVEHLTPGCEISPVALVAAFNERTEQRIMPRSDPRIIFAATALNAMPLPPKPITATPAEPRDRSNRRQPIRALAEAPGPRGARRHVQDRQKAFQLLLLPRNAIFREQRNAALVIRTNFVFAPTATRPSRVVRMFK